MNDGHPISQPYSRAGLLAKLTGAAILAAGALLHGQGTALLATLPLGTAGRVLVAGASAPAWSDSGLSYASSVLTVAGSVPGTPAAGQVFVGGGAIKAGGAISCNSLSVASGLLTVTGVGYGANNSVVLDAVSGTANLRFTRDLSSSLNGGSAEWGLNVFYSSGWNKDAAAASSGYLAMVPSGTAGQYTKLVYSGITADGTTPVQLWSIGFDGAMTAAGIITAGNGSAVSPAFRTTTYAHGIYSYDATNLGISVAGALALRVNANGTLYTERFSLTGTATTGAQVFHGMTTSGGENLNLQYQESAVGSLPADVWTLRLGGSSPRAIHVTSFDTSSLFSISATGIVNIPNATASTSTTTGALVVTGGVGVGGSLYASEVQSSGSITANSRKFGAGSTSSATYIRSAGLTYSLIELQSSDGTLLATFGAYANKFLIYDSTGGHTNTQMMIGAGAPIGSERLRIAGGSIATAGATDICLGAGVIDIGASLRYRGTQILGAQGAAVADASGGATVDAEARTAINALLARMRAHGAIAT